MIWTVLLSLCIIKGIGKKFKTIQEISLCPATAQTPALRLRPNYPPVPVTWIFMLTPDVLRFQLKGVLPMQHSLFLCTLYSVIFPDCPDDMYFLFWAKLAKIMLSNCFLIIMFYNETTTLDFAHSGRWSASTDTLSTNVRWYFSLMSCKVLKVSSIPLPL